MRIGIMGGTFDPPHLGHLIPVEIAAAEFSLDRVWYVPACTPPHKHRDDLTDPFHRAAMLALALHRYPRFLLSPLELLQEQISYTIDTITAFKRNLAAEDKLFFILGSDSFLEIHTWFSYDRLIQLCEFIIINRGNRIEELKEKLQQLEATLQLELKPSIHFACTSHLPISSTEIRSAIQSGQDVSSMLSPEVEAYIRKYSLYQRR